MKYTVGDWVIFNQDCRLAFSCIPKGKTGEITDIVDTGLAIYYRIKMQDYLNATVPTDKADEACTKIKSNHCEKVEDLEEAKTKGSHYEKAAMQPLEVMQRLMTAEQFKGFLLGNCIKYRMRCEQKGQRESDLYKARQYAYWLEMVKDGHRINPSRDKVPFDYDFKVV
jgi:hypothetical protein